MEPADSAQIAFYLERARRGGAVALELGCGTGVVAAALALAGVRVTALEPSRRQLARALERRRALGLGPEALRLEGGDLRGARLGERFPFVYLPANGLLVQGGLEDVLAVFTTAHRHLAPGGSFGFDVRPSPRRDEAPPRTPAEFRAFLARRPHLSRRASGGHPAGVHRLKLLDLSPAEIEWALEAAGLTPLERWGGFSEEPFLPESEKLVVVAAAARPEEEQPAAGW